MNRSALCICVIALAACGPQPTAANHASTPTQQGNTPTASGDANHTNTSTDTGIDPNTPYRFLGRFDTNPQSATYGRFGWPGTGIGATFTGTGITLNMNDTGGVDNGQKVYSQFDVSIDNQAPTTLVMQGNVTSYPLATNLPAGQHTVWVTKRTEAWIGVTQFVSMQPTGNGNLTGAPAAKPHHMEFVGASTECGYGDTESLPAGACQFSIATEDADIAYPKLTADTLNADYADIAYSGKGVYRNIFPDQDSTTLPMMYNRVDPDESDITWNFTQWTPDVVVIDLGGNDFEAFGGTNNTQALPPPDPNAFISAYAGFLKTVRSNYPNAHIWGVVGPTDLGDVRTGMTNDIQGALSQLGDAKMHFYAFPTYTGPTYGCDDHPDAALHKLMAQQLSAEIAKTVGW